jgi:hypothetical protein
MAAQPRHRQGRGVFFIARSTQNLLCRLGGLQTPSGEAKFALGDNRAIDRRNSLHEREIMSKFQGLHMDEPVKFAVEKRKLFVIDKVCWGQEHEMKVVKKVLRQPQQQP